jgi:hypothetical protein
MSTAWETNAPFAQPPPSGMGICAQSELELAPAPPLEPPLPPALVLPLEVEPPDEPPSLLPPPLLLESELLSDREPPLFAPTPRAAPLVPREQDSPTQPPPATPRPLWVEGQPTRASNTVTMAPAFTTTSIARVGAWS